ncbi:hypothetical protein D3C72_942290 [compost metagenome]
MQEGNLVRQFLPFRYNQACQHIVMTTQILTRTVYDNIRSKLKRPLEIRGHERIIHDGQDPVPLGPRTDSFDIRNHHQGIGRGLDNQRFGVRLADLLQSIQIIRIHIGSGDSVFAKDPLD